MLVYYFTKSCHGLSNLSNRHIKVSRFDDLNDPFELLGIETSDKGVRDAMRFEKSEIARSKGLICFSESKYNPVQWAHYADNHLGICLGFEIPDAYLKPVKYVSLRLAKSVLSEKDKQEKILTTKFKHWSYEEERRWIIELAENTINDGMIFKSFSSNLKLREIYIGCNSKLTYSDVQNYYRSEDRKVIVKHTRPAFKDFRIVWDKSKKSAHA